MSSNGQIGNSTSQDIVLRWSGRVLAFEDLRRSLNGHRELILGPQTIVTPLAAEHLRIQGIQISRRVAEKAPAPAASWGYAQDRQHPLVASAVQAMQRDGLNLKALQSGGESSACQWARLIAECVARGECRGGVVFCQDPALVCCVANKVAGLRAAPVASVTQAARATLTLGANLVAVEMPGRTFFEVRQILRTLCQPADLACPPNLACTLRELDGHAHR